MDKLPVRVRLAPSPTGDVHLGTLWIAHFQWLFARQHGGQFVLRIEDTDQKRLVPDSLDRIYEALDWYGLQPDEGPLQGGSFGPYIQSQRLPHYQQAVEQLIQTGNAYYCFCTAERLDELRQRQQAAKQPPRYDKHCATLDSAEVKDRRDRGEVAVVRMKLPSTGQIIHHDLIRGDVTFQLHELDDSVLLKSDGFPTYHLAVVVDDHLMKITHVIRAEEWLPSVPKHLWLYQAFGWTPPIFAHLPLILGPDGSKLSKRHGATAALWFRDHGYLPEAMKNFFGLMGWHPKGDDEVLTEAQLMEQFKLEEINPAGAKFDQAKLDWLNGFYIRQLSIENLYTAIKPFWHRPDDVGDQAHQVAVLKLVQDRLIKLEDVDSFANFMFPSVWNQEHSGFDAQLLVPKKGDRSTTHERLVWVKDWLTTAMAWDAAALKQDVLAAIKAAGFNNSEVLWPLRVCLSLRVASPDVFDLLSVLGQAESLRRIEKCLLSTKPA